MNVMIFGEFLGAGKTTVLLQLARWLTGICSDSSEGDSDCNVMGLENEIGEMSVDGNFLEGSGFQVKNLFAGCICCSLSGELLETVYRIQENIRPQWLIIETTGIADPEPIRDSLLQAFQIEARICCVADAKRWKRLYAPMENLLKRQLAPADLVLINKTDSATPQELGEITDCIRRLATKPDRQICQICALEPINPGIWMRLVAEHA